MGLLFDVLPWLGGAAMVLLAFFGVKHAGKKEAHTERALQDAKAANETHERMNDAPTSDGMHDDDIKRLLAERGKRDSRA